MKFSVIKGHRARALLLGGVLVVGAGSALAIAQARHAPRDPASMPEFRGTVLQYDLSPRGDVDGLILADGTEVHFPPHMGRDVQAAVRPGDAVTVRGERNGPVVRAGSVAGATGAAVVDRGPPAGGPRPDKPATQAMEEAGTVRMQLHGPRGELNGVLMEGGTIVHLPPKEAGQLADAIKPGQAVAVRGEGVSGPAGRLIRARAFGPSMDRLVQIEASKPPKGPDKPGVPTPPAPKPAAG